MVFIAVLEEVLEVVVVVWHLFEGEVLSEGFTHVEDLAILPFVLFKQGAIDLVEFLYLGHCPHADIGIA